MTLREDIPLGYNYDDHGNVLTFKGSSGYWSESTYDEHGNVLTFKDSSGYWCERTRDAHGNEMSYKDSEGDWSECTRDTHGNELKYTDKDGEWLTLAEDARYTLRFLNGIYWAGCRLLSREEALAHWRERTKAISLDTASRAVAFHAAIINHKE